MTSRPEPQPPAVLHVSGDYPDPIEPAKTPVIATLVELTRDSFQHEVLSLNRQSPSPAALFGQILHGLGRPRVGLSCQPFADGTAVAYTAPGRGLYHATLLRQLGDSLAERIGPDKRPDLIVGHKLTIEGIVVRRMAQRLGVPYAISLQGDTDTKILGARPDLAREFARVFHEAAIVFPFTPWAMRKVEDRLGRRAGPAAILPCPTDLDQPLAPGITGSKELLTVFHLKNHKRKNLKGMADAMRMLAVSDPDVRLTIIGGGSEADVASCNAVLAGLDNVSLAGPMGHAELRQRFNAAAAFVMPSLRESFGLVFIEALFSGLPVIYPADTAIDGFFDQAEFALRTDARSADEIAACMRRAVAQEAQIKQALGGWQTSKDARRFGRPAIAADFTAGLHRALDR